MPPKKGKNTVITSISSAVSLNNLQARVSRIKSYVDNFDSENDVNQLRSRLTILQKCWENYEAISDFDDIEDEAEDFENSYCDLLGAIQSKLDKLDKTCPKPNGSELNLPSGSVYNASTNIRLPTIKLVTFDGDYDKWITFYDTYSSLIHTNETLTKIQKFHYLRSSLEKEPFQLIENLSTSADNYDVAWELLKSRYQNRRLIIMKHVRSLFDIAKAEKQSQSSIRIILEGLSKHISALKALDQPTDQWDTLVIHLITIKLDYLTMREWENSLTSDSLPSVKDLEEFLSHKVQVLEALESNRPVSNPKTSSSTNNSSNNKHSTGAKDTYRRSTLHTSVASNTVRKRTCQKCAGDHPIFACADFKALSHSDKLREVKRHKLCENCLLPGHEVRQCRFSSCRTCHKRHNTALCTQTSSHVASNPLNQTSSHNNLSTPSSQVSHSSVPGSSKVILLCTALIEILDRSGISVPARALLDSGSQSNFITESLAQRLGLKRDRINFDVTGIDHSKTSISSSVYGNIKSRVQDFASTLNFLVVPRITQDIPQVPVDTSQLNIPPDLLLADPHFNQPGKIDLLVGAELFFGILHTGQIHLSNDTILQSTSFGWVVSGSTPINRQNFISTCHLSTINRENQLDVQIERFWKIEDSHLNTYSLTPEEKECEEHFKKTITRDKDGRFIVTLPCKESIDQIGSTKEVALKRFYHNMKKLDKDSTVKSRYYDFMREYIELEHMRKVPRSDSSTGEHRRPVYHIPHHAVHKEESSTTKLRVVFDASTKSSSGISLNDALKVGPVVQQDLFSIIVRFRKHAVVLTADITKMYRQIKLNPDQFDLHRIFWWDDESDSVEEYQLNTLTYGTAPASFIATRCLKQLAEDGRNKFPLAASILEKDMYMDDLLTGFESDEEALIVRTEIIDLLATAGMELRKWASNSKNMLDAIPVEHREISKPLRFESDGVIKTLGLGWNAQQDYFVYGVSINFEQRITKRNALSEICRLFDPLGLVAPIIIRAKIFMQRTWELKITWDEILPDELCSTWSQFRSDLVQLNSLSVPRNIMPNSDISVVELHGFCDASELAFGACIYLRSISPEGVISTRLVCSKSRVAPLKQTTIPRLELSGAVLLSELFDRVINALDLHIHQYYLWTDSTIVLGWLNTTTRLKTFVSNRVLQILDVTTVKNWHHIRSEYNPADCLSRGTTASELISMELWWNGPKWLSLTQENWPIECWNSTTELPEVKVESAVFASIESPNLLSKFSDFNKILRITAIWLRFIRNCRKDTKMTGPVFSPYSIENALHHWIRIVQLECFPSEIKALTQNKPLKPKSKLASLNPFLDEERLIRVGGRLSRAELNYNQKHPFVLPSKHIFTNLIIRTEHLRLLHAGPQALLSSIRKKFWPLRGKDQVRRVCLKCVTCFRAKPRDVEQLMGSLPPHRIEPSRPFLRTGVDFCGPMFIYETRRRKSRVVKCYVSVFVCFCTKAVHLELVSDLTSQAFIAALKRFIGRRGLPSYLYSDNATNFVGARNELKELHNLFNDSEHQNKLKGIVNWSYIPPRSPYHGGLWEASVKSLKYHLKRIIGNTSLTTEEFNTVLIQVEACLNSRPLTPSSSDPSDLGSLTPGHFLIGEELTSIPEPNLLPLKIGLLSRWQLVQRLLQQFWKRWSAEYLGSLQQRSKWKSSSPNLSLGTLVLLKEDNLPPMKWKLGRITDLHPGEDGLVRVVSVFTSGGVRSRAITKVCPLPIDV